MASSPDGKLVVGHQCKRVEKFTREQLEAEYKKAQQFSVPLTKYIVYTTIKRDTDLQMAALELTRNGPFSCSIMGWEDVEQDLSNAPELIEKFYKDFMITATEWRSNGILVELNLPESAVLLFLIRIGESIGGSNHQAAQWLGDSILLADIHRSKYIPIYTNIYQYALVTIE